MFLDETTLTIEPLNLCKNRHMVKLSLNLNQTSRSIQLTSWLFSIFYDTSLNISTIRQSDIDIKDKLLFKRRQKYLTPRHFCLQCVLNSVTADDENRKRSHQHTPCRRTTQCMHTHSTHTHTDPFSNHIQVSSSLIFDFITEKAHPCFLLFKPDASTISLPLFCFSPRTQTLFFIVLWSMELFFYSACPHI